MDDLPAFLSLEQVYLHASSVCRLLDRKEFLTQIREYLAAGKLMASGYRNAWGERVEIPRVVWSEYSPVFELGGCAVLAATPDEEVIKAILPIYNIGDRRLEPGRLVVAWTDLRIPRDSLAEFSEVGQNLDQMDDPKAPYKTGAPGRPSAIQFVEAEALLRRESGVASLSLAVESRNLHAWCKDKHPKISTPGVHTIENRIRADHKSWKVGLQTPHN